jgi:hypothetical protein
MVELSIFEKYLDEFHDGRLIDIDHSDGNYVFTIQSAEMGIEDMKHDIALSEWGCISGKLHVEKVFC